MFRKSLPGIVLGILATLAALPAWSQTADEIIAKNLAARGGLDKIKAVQTARTTGTMTLGPGMEAPFTMEVKRPNSMRMEVNVQGMAVVQAYDGKRAWQINPMQGSKEAQPLPDEALKQIDLQADSIDGPLVDYKAKGSTVELVGKEKVGANDAYKLKITLKAGDVLYDYIDATQFLEVRMDAKMKVRGQELESESTIGDYRNVDGIMIAFSMESRPKGSPQSQRMIFKKVELNVPIDDARFKMPGAK